MEKLIASNKNNILLKNSSLKEFTKNKYEKNSCSLNNQALKTFDKYQAAVVINKRKNSENKNSKLKSNLKYNNCFYDLKNYSGGKNTIQAESMSKEKLKASKNVCASNYNTSANKNMNMNLYTNDKIISRDKRMNNNFNTINSKIDNLNVITLASKSNSLGRSPRNKKVDLHHKFSEKETNSKTDTTIFDKKDFTSNTNKAESYEISLLRSVEIEENKANITGGDIPHIDKEKYFSNFSGLEIPPIEKNQFTPSLDDKDKMIVKLNSRISDLECKLKEMEEKMKSNKQDTNDSAFVMNTISCKNQNMNTALNTDYSTQNNNYIFTSLDHNSFKCKSLSRKKSTIPNIKISNNNKESNEVGSMFKRNSMTGKHLIKDSYLIRQKLTDKLKNSFNSNNINKTLFTGNSDNLTINLDFFKPIAPKVTKSTLFDMYSYNNKNLFNSSINCSKTNNKSSHKNSFDSKSKEKIKKDYSVNESPRIKPNLRKYLLINEFNKNNYDESVDYKLPIDNSFPKADNKMEEKLNKIKEKTKLLLTKLTVSNKKLIDRLKKNSYSKSNIY